MKRTERVPCTCNPYRQPRDRTATGYRYESLYTPAYTVHPTNGEILQYKTENKYREVSRPVSSESINQQSLPSLISANR